MLAVRDIIMSLAERYDQYVFHVTINGGSDINVLIQAMHDSLPQLSLLFPSSSQKRHRVSIGYRLRGWMVRVMPWVDLAPGTCGVSELSDSCPSCFYSVLFIFLKLKAVVRVLCPTL